LSKGTLLEGDALLFSTAKGCTKGGGIDLYITFTSGKYMHEDVLCFVFSYFV